MLLLGRNGQIGSALLRTGAPGWAVTALDRQSADFLVPQAAARAVRSAGADIVVNAAGWTDVDGAEAEPGAARRVNADAVAELAEAVGDGCLIHYSTNYVFDGTKPSPYDELDDTNPVNAYGSGKLAGEEAIAATGCRHLIFRTSWVHAAGHANFLTTVLRLAAERNALRIVDDRVGAPTSAALVAAVTLKVIDMIAGGRPPESGIYHLAARGAATWREYAVYVIECAEAAGLNLACGPAAVASIGSDEYPQKARRPRNSRLSTVKLEAALGLALPDWREGVRDTVEQTISGTTA